MKKTLLFIAIAAVGISSSCSITEDLEDPQDIELSTIDFASGRVVNPTKADEKVGSEWDAETDANNPADKVGIFAMLTHDDRTEDTQPSGTGIWTPAFSTNFAKNIMLTYTASGSWSPGSALYWPANSDDRITFFAYHPWSGNEVSMPEVNATTGAITMDHNVEIFPSIQEDLLWAWVRNAHKDDMNGSKDGNPSAVPFTFEHALTKISFTAKTTIDTEVATVKITDLSITAKLKNKLTIHGDNLTWGDGNIGDAKKIHIIGEKGENCLEDAHITITNNPEESQDGFSSPHHVLLMVPQLLESARIDITYEIKYNQGAKVTETGIYYPTGTWVRNNHITYNLNITAEEIKFSANVRSWGTETTTPLPVPTVVP